MRKILIYILGFVLLCFTIPVLFTKKMPKNQEKIEKNSENLNSTNNIISMETVPYEYKNYGEVRLLHLNTGEVETIAMDEYLYGVVSAEMPASFEIEALKAQAVVARTYTAYKMYKGSKHENADICDQSTCCQAWISKEDRLEKWNEIDRENNWNKITNAVDETTGKIITYNGEPINSFFHSNSGGSTEIVSNVWGGNDYPYLKSVETSGEEGYTQYASKVTLTKEEVLKKIEENHSEVVIDFNDGNAIQILEYTDSGRVRTIQFGNIQISGVEAREIFGLKSAKFNIDVSDNITFNVTGYGHGVGMSQTGADAMAKVGSTYEQIINHYYTDIKIENT